MQTSTNNQTPSHQDLLAELFESGCDINSLIQHYKLSPAQFLAFAKDPLVIEILDAWEAFQERHQRVQARQHQAGAAGFLHQAIMDAPTTIESRRAATALARLATIMQDPPKRRKPGIAAPAETTRAESTTSPAPSGETGRTRGNNAAGETPRFPYAPTQFPQRPSLKFRR